MVSIRANALMAADRTDTRTGSTKDSAADTAECSQLPAK